VTKHYISAQQLLDDSFSLAIKVLESDYKPNFIVGIWRGGAPVAIAVQELLNYVGVECDHFAIRTSHYTGIEDRASEVKVDGLDYLVKHISANDRLLLVDDVFDSGLSINQILLDLDAQYKNKLPEIKVGTPYFKPKKNQTSRVPDFYLHETDDWLVFPHELNGLGLNEILLNKPEIDVLTKLLKTVERSK
jgi:hypoxanthine phosphoribosyltransferase